MGLTAGLLAGAAGTVALNVTTYLDMTIRGRSPSGMPADVAGRLAERAGIELAADEQTAANRRSGLGALLGYVAGLGVGAAYGLLREDGGTAVVDGVALGLAAMAATDTPATVLGVTDPRSWPATSWASDIVPHLAYGFVTAAAYRRITG